MPRVVHFELLSDDPEQSVKFFDDVFGWTNQSWEGQTYWLVHTGDEELGIDGGIMRASPNRSCSLLPTPCISTSRRTPYRFVSSRAITQ